MKHTHYTPKQTYEDYKLASIKMIERETRDLIAQIKAQSLKPEDKAELFKSVAAQFLVNSLV